MTDQNDTTTTMADEIGTPFHSLTEELLLHVSSFLPARDLLQFQSTCKDVSDLDTDSLWNDLCVKRWQNWPRFRLTPQRQQALDEVHACGTWQQHYVATEAEATRTQLRESDLQDLKWYLSFVLSGIRGEGRSDHMAVLFNRENKLFVPGHPPLDYRIVDSPPPSSSEHIRPTLRGDRPFLTQQWLQISDFPPHFITRKESDAEWLIVNQNVMIVSCKRD